MADGTRHPRIGFVEPAELVVSLGQDRGSGRKKARLAQLVEQPAAFLSELGGLGGITGQQLDERAAYPTRRGERNTRASLRELLAEVAQLFPRLAEATRHRRRVHSGAAERPTALVALTLLIPSSAASA